MKKILTFLTISLFTSSIFAQDSDILLNHDGYHYIDRLDIRGYTNQMVHTDVKPYGRKYISSLFEAADTSKMRQNEKRWHNRMRLILDDEYAETVKEKGIIFKQLYKNKRDFYHYSDKNFRVYLNPIMDLSAGVEMQNYGGSYDRRLLSTNTRGVVIRGDFMRKIGFYTEVADNVMVPQTFIHKHYPVEGAFFGETFVKNFKSDPSKKDFFAYRAYLTYSPIKQMRIKFGYDRNFLGNGYHSLLLSDNAPNYLMLNIVTKIWKLEYMNHFTQMIDFFPTKNDTEGPYPRKYGVFHQLTYKPIKNLSLGAFESVIYNPYHPNGKRGLELQYLNPVIFYRGVEQMIGSSDNAVIGFVGKYNFLKHFQVYGQFLLDEMKVAYAKEILNGKRGAFTSKTGYQLGIKYIDAFSIPTLDLQMEYNQVRPYTYQHTNSSSNYTNYGQVLGYAWGANARSLDLILNYHPFPQWHIYAVATRGTKGNDINNINYGGDATIPYVINRPQDSTGAFTIYNHFVGQGGKVKVTQLFGTISYQIYHTDMYIDGGARFRKEGQYTSAGAWLGFRANMSRRMAKF